MPVIEQNHRHQDFCGRGEKRCGRPGQRYFFAQIMWQGSIGKINKNHRSKCCPGALFGAKKTGAKVVHSFFFPHTKIPEFWFYNWYYVTNQFSILQESVALSINLLVWNYAHLQDTNRTGRREVRSEANNLSKMIICKNTIPTAPDEGRCATNCQIKKLIV